MSDNHNREFAGKIGGHAVRHMIEEVEEDMAAGKRVSAKSSSKAEADALQNVRKENQESGKSGRQQ